MHEAIRFLARVDNNEVWAVLARAQASPQTSPAPHKQNRWQRSMEKLRTSEYGSQRGGRHLTEARWKSVPSRRSRNRWQRAMDKYRLSELGSASQAPQQARQKSAAAESGGAAESSGDGAELHSPALAERSLPPLSDSAALLEKEGFKARVEALFAAHTAAGSDANDAAARALLQARNEQLQAATQT